MQSWDGLRLALAGRGYRQITYIELTCPADGDFRGAISPEFDSPACPCPKCTAPSPYANLGRGFTRRETIPWVRVQRATPTAWKTDNLDNETPRQGPRLPIYKPSAPDHLGKSADISAEGVEASETIPKAEKTLTARDVAILRLLAEDLPPDSVAEKLNPPTNGRAVVMAMYRVRKVLHCSTTTGAVQ
jgi:hypothetical protein